MSNEIYKNEKYRVVIIDDALGEDGKYGAMGYAVVNIETNIREHTTTVLPQALFQADAFMGALSNLHSDEEKAIMGNSSDVVDPDSIN